MGRLDDIIERNRKQLEPKRGWAGMAAQAVKHEFDPNVDAETRRTRLLALGIAITIAVAVVLAIWLWPRGGAAGGVVTARDGRKVELASLWSKRRVVAVFYPGRGCDSCTYILSDLEARRRDIDADIIGISSHSRAHADQLHERLKLGFELYVDPALQVIPKWGVPFVAADTTGSAVFVIERGGAISYKAIGALPSMDELIAKLDGTASSR
jgi:peroxiredoxin